MRFITRWWRHGGRMITYIPVLLLLDLGGPSTATALQFDTYSVSAFIEPPSTTGFPQTATQVTATRRISA